MTVTFAYRASAALAVMSVGQLLTLVGSGVLMDLLYFEQREKNWVWGCASFLQDGIRTVEEKPDVLTVAFHFSGTV